MCDFYKDDISKMQLQAQLPLLQALFAEEKNQSELSINDIIKRVDWTIFPENCIYFL